MKLTGKVIVLNESRSEFLILIPCLDFAIIDRIKLSEEHASGAAADEFDTKIHGPWMNRWDIVHHNKHTDSLKKGSSWHSNRFPGLKA